MDTKQEQRAGEKRETLTASAAPITGRRYGSVTLPSGRRVQMDRGQDSATLIRRSTSE